MQTSSSTNVAEDGANSERGDASKTPRVSLFVATFAAGFAITGIEMALGRLLAPYFGSSLTVWAAIIASIIGALSIGYPIGGWLADRKPGPLVPLVALLVGGLVGAAMGVIAPHWLRTALAGVGFSGFGFWSRLGLVLFMFSLPCITLAAVAPSVLRATLRDRTTAGRDAGGLYALGSLGSVLGILLPALWWIPLLGMRATFLLIGAASVIPAAIGLLSLPSGPRRSVAITGLLFATAFAVPEATRLADEPNTQVLYDRDSGLQRIRVVASG